MKKSYIQPRIDNQQTALAFGLCVVTSIHGETPLQYGGGASSGGDVEPI